MFPTRASVFEEEAVGRVTKRKTLGMWGEGLGYSSGGPRRVAMGKGTAHHNKRA